MDELISLSAIVTSDDVTMIETWEVPHSYIQHLHHVLGEPVASTVLPNTEIHTGAIMTGEYTVWGNEVDE